MKCVLCNAELLEDAAICRVCGLINPGAPLRKEGEMKGVAQA